MAYHLLIRPALFYSSLLFTIAFFLIIILTVFFRHILKGKKKVIHGAEFQLPKATSDDGFYIGKYSRDVLPGQISEFSKSHTKPIFIPYNSLSRTTTILGDMGCGKSRLMYVFHNAIKEKYPDIPILIHDPKGEWLRTFYDPKKDLIFAPFDKRTCAWTLWKDFQKYPELRHSVISTAVESQNAGGSDRYWSNSATVLLKDAACKLDVISAAKLLSNKKDENKEDKTFLSTYSIAQISFRDMVSIELLNNETVHPDRKSKSLTDILNHKGRIFLLNNPSCASEQHSGLALLLSAFLLRAISLADMPAGKLRAAVIIDEALTFHLPADIERSIYSQCRSKGLCIIASGQRLPGKNEQGAWATQSANMFGMRVSDLATRKSLSERIGKMRYSEKQRSTSSSDKSFSTTKSDTQRQHDVLAPEDFGKLKNREFILFHDNGVAPGRIKNVTEKQTDENDPFEYMNRIEIVDFMSHYGH